MTIRSANWARGMRTTALPSGEVVPVLGQGTWGMAEDTRRRRTRLRRSISASISA